MKANLLMLACFAISVALAILFVLVFKTWRKRGKRRSPLKDRQAGHVPGQQLVERVSDSGDDLLLSVIVMYFAFPVMLLAWALLRVPADRFRFDGHAWPFLVGAVLMFAWGARGFAKHWDARQAARDGLLAERVTGMQLNRLVAQNCLVLHDLPGEGFNIDHVVVAPRGVYVVETKSFRKPKDAKQDKSYRVTFEGGILRFPDFAEKDAVAQAERYAGWLTGILRQAQFDASVIPALALPGWLVDQTEETWRNSKVKVFSPMGSGANFMAKDLGRIDSAERSRIAQALALRYPRIAD